MIRFNCHCSHEFLVSEDQAGGMVQCPKCSRLNDVPTLGDMEHLEDGGIFKIEDKVVTPKLNLNTAKRTFSKDREDDSGDEIDMRPSVDQFMNIGAGSPEVPIDLADENLPQASMPKYDPL